MSPSDATIEGAHEKRCRRKGRETVRLSWGLALNVSLIARLVVAGLTAHSLGVLAAAGDTAADASAIGLRLLAVWLRDHRGKATAPTYVAGSMQHCC